MEKATVVKNALVPDMDSGKWKRVNLLLRNGITEQISENVIENVSDAEVIDVKGNTLLPSFTDLRTHVNLPPHIRNSDFNTLSAAAKAGGFSTVLTAPFAPFPIADSKHINTIINLSSAIRTEVIPVMSVTDEKGNLTDLEAGVKEGAAAVCSEGINDTVLIEKAMKIAKNLNVLFIVHASDSNPEPEDKGYSAYRMGKISTLSEDMSTAQAISLAERTGCRIHITCVSSEFSVSQIRRAKNAGMPVTCDTCPQYFSLTASDILFYGNCVKLNHPLRKQSDVEAIKEAIADGTVDAVSTDHTPLSAIDKSYPFDKAPVGMLGLQTAFSASLSNLVKPGVITLSRLAELLSYNPAKIIGREVGIKVGMKADFAVCDIDCEYILSESDLGEKDGVKNTPWLGQMMYGKVIGMIQ